MILLAIALASATPSPPVEAVTVASGLRHPWSLAFLPTGDFLVTEKDGGLVRVTRDGTRIPVAGLPADLDNVRQTPGDNSGMFDVALHPDFSHNRRLYFTYTAKGDGGTTTRLAAARLVGDRLENVTTLFDATPYTAERYHYGGGLLISRDRHIYMTVGERHFHERDNPPLPVAQDPSSRHGKVYRFTLEGKPARGNPDFGRDGVPGLYAIGIRASQGLAQDPESGRIWLSEHGPTSGDEINLLVPGANYGWPAQTAGRFRDAEYRPARALPDAVYTAPVWSWTDRTVAPTGLTVYTGSAFPEWRGDLIITGLAGGNLMRADIQRGQVVGIDYLMTDAPVRLRNVKQAPDGTLYLLTDEREGRILRLARADETRRGKNHSRAEDTDRAYVSAFNMDALSEFAGPTCLKPFLPDSTTTTESVDEFVKSGRTYTSCISKKIEAQRRKSRGLLQRAKVLDEATEAMAKERNEFAAALATYEPSP